MADFHDPDETRRVAVAGHEVVTYSWGAGEEVVFLLSGGPGLVIRWPVGALERVQRRRPEYLEISYVTCHDD